MQRLVFLWITGSFAAIFLLLTIVGYFSGPQLLVYLAETSTAHYACAAAESIAAETAAQASSPTADRLRAQKVDVRISPLDPAQPLRRPRVQIVHFNLNIDCDVAAHGTHYLVQTTLPVQLFRRDRLPWPQLIRWGGGLIFLVFLSYLLSRQVTVPLQRLRDAARRFAQGDLDARAHAATFPRHPHELHQFAVDFDDLAQRLQSHIASQRTLLEDVSHELRSPLTRLSLAVSIARRHAPDAAAPLNRIDQEVTQLNRLIEHTLQLAKLDRHLHQKDIPLTREPLSLRDLLTDLTADADFEARAHHRHVELHAPADVTLSADRALLASAIENVIRNAIRHTPETTAVHVTLTTAAQQVQIQIQDSGPGIPPSELDAVFQPFYRLDRGRDHRHSGTGLGLAIARRAILAHSGTIAATNHPPHGLTVTITLPH